MITQELPRRVEIKQVTPVSYVIKSYPEGLELYQVSKQSDGRLVSLPRLSEATEDFRIFEAFLRTQLGEDGVLRFVMNLIHRGRPSAQISKLDIHRYTGLVRSKIEMLIRYGIDLGIFRKVGTAWCFANNAHMYFKEEYPLRRVEEQMANISVEDTQPLSSTEEHIHDDPLGVWNPELEKVFAGDRNQEIVPIPEKSITKPRAKSKRHVLKKKNR